MLSESALKKEEKETSEEHGAFGSQGEASAKFSGELLRWAALQGYPRLEKGQVFTLPHY